MKRLFLITALSVLLIGCSTIKQKMDPWLGHTKNELIMSWGPPARISSDGNNGEVLVYARQVYAPQMGWNYWDYKMMYVNTDGLIYHWKTSKQQIPPTQVQILY